MNRVRTLLHASEIAWRLPDRAPAKLCAFSEWLQDGSLYRLGRGHPRPIDAALQPRATPLFDANALQQQVAHFATAAVDITASAPTPPAPTGPLSPTNFPPCVLDTLRGADWTQLTAAGSSSIDCTLEAIGYQGIRATLATHWQRSDAAAATDTMVGVLQKLVQHANAASPGLPLAAPSDCSMAYVALLDQWTEHNCRTLPAAPDPPHYVRLRTTVLEPGLRALHERREDPNIAFRFRALGMLDLAAYAVARGILPPAERARVEALAEALFITSPFGTLCTHYQWALTMRRYDTARTVAEAISLHHPAADPHRDLELIARALDTIDWHASWDSDAVCSERELHRAISVLQRAHTPHTAPALAQLIAQLRQSID